MNEENNNVASEVINEVINNGQTAAPVVDATKESGVWDDSKYELLALAGNRDNPNINTGLPRDYAGSLKLTEISDTFQVVEGKNGKKDSKWVPIQAVDLNDGVQYTLSLSKVFRLTGPWTSSKATERLKQLHKSVMSGKCVAKVTDGSWEEPTATRDFIRKNLKGTIVFG